MCSPHHRPFLSRSLFERKQCRPASFTRCRGLIPWSNNNCTLTYLEIQLSHSHLPAHTSTLSHAFDPMRNEIFIRIFCNNEQWLFARPVSSLCAKLQYTCYVSINTCECVRTDGWIVRYLCLAGTTQTKRVLLII